MWNVANLAQFGMIISMLVIGASLLMAAWAAAEEKRGLAIIMVVTTLLALFVMGISIAKIDSIRQQKDREIERECYESGGRVLTNDDGAYDGCIRPPKS